MINYRQEINGLRAIAVLAVLFFHAEFIINGINLFQGGFIGVDIFFVISGYLITSIIIQDLKDKKFSFLNFYERRARRILPILCLILIFTFIFSWYLFLPLEMEKYSSSALSSILFSSNFWFYDQADYWNNLGSIKPLLHTWSLSLEEQFYIFFPLIVFFFWKYLKKYLLILFSLSIVISLFIANEYSVKEPEYSFYLMPARIWELLSGSIMAILEINYGRKRYHSYNKFAPLLGLLLIFYSITFFSEETIHPSLNTLIPILGAVLIIWFSEENNLVTKFLSSKLLVLVGLISYSLYMWHYPIFEFYKIINDSPSYYEKFGLIALTLILSIISYKFVEKPFRNFNFITSKNFIILCLTIIIIIIFANLSVIVKNGNLYRFSGEKMNLFTDSSNLKLAKGNPLHPVHYVNFKYNSSEFNKDFSDPNKRNIFLHGDSFSQDFFNILYEGGFFKKYEISATRIRRECNIPSFIDLKKIIGEKEFNSQKCAEAIRIGNPIINSKILDADLVILSSAWTEDSYNYILKTVEYLESIGVKKIIVVGQKRMPLLSDFKWKNLSINRLKEDTFIIHQENEIFGRITKMRELNINNFIDIQFLICGSDNTCPILAPDNKLISYDSRHLTKSGAKLVSEILKNDATYIKLFE